MVPEGLLINSVQLRDSGNYYCRASNALGSVELRTLLILQDVGEFCFTLLLNGVLLKLNLIAQQEKEAKMIFYHYGKTKKSL